MTWCEKTSEIFFEVFCWEGERMIDNHIDDEFNLAYMRRAIELAKREPAR